MLENIKEPNDIHKIPEEKLYVLANEIRRLLIKTISERGGHLASNLGVVELTVALHAVYDLPKDKIIWDVGHQSYTHKILTGRKDVFDSLRTQGGISGFPRRAESECDCIDSGHSSTSISAGIGYVRARELTGDDYKVVSVIGDGALTGGMAFEALNNMTHLNQNFVIVLNDNEMSISKNVGGISEYLDNIRTSSSYTNLKMSVSSALDRVPVIGSGTIEWLRKTKSSIKQLVIPGMFFENLGITYLGPVDGHNIHQMMKVFKEAKAFNGPVIVHVITEKGRGYRPARNNPARFHGTSSFQMKTGKPVQEKKESYTDIFSETIVEIATEDPAIVAITAAMREGVGLEHFSVKYPARFFDVGIAEQHAVTFAAGLALGGLKPVVPVYSSFMQRAFDQILMDVCLQELPVVFALDRAGLVGEDGKTHQGCFDLSYMSMMPGMTLMAPKNGRELKDMLNFAAKLNEPVAVRYPRGTACRDFEEFIQPIEKGKAEVLKDGKGIALLAVGSMVSIAMEAADELKEKGIDCTVVNMRFIKPLDTDLLKELSAGHKVFLTMEENVRSGGFGQQVSDTVSKEGLGVFVHIAAVEDDFVAHGTVEQQRQAHGLDKDSIVKKVLELVKEKSVSA